MPSDNLTVDVLRADDLLALTFEFIGLMLDTTAGQAPRLVRWPGRPGPAFMVVHFAPQHIVEEAFLEDSNGNLLGLHTPPVGSVLSGLSRLVFKVPDDRKEIPFTLKSLLAWNEYEAVLAPTALPNDDSPGPSAPSPTDPDTLPTPVTAIEFPYRLLISPVGSPGWVHALEGPVTHDGASELWHTRLGTLQGQTVDEGGELFLRAIWSPDVQSPGGSQFNATLTSENRIEIVRLSADFSITSQLVNAVVSVLPRFPGLIQLAEDFATYRPKPIRTERLMLSALGGWLHARGSWHFPEIPPSVPFKPFGLQEWRHIATMARDQYVRVVKRGFLCPFGHRAMLITVSERKFKHDSLGETVANLAQPKIVVVQEPEKDYNALSRAYASLQGEGREMPLRRVRITTLATPNLSNPNEAGIFLPEVDGASFFFHLVAEDWDRELVDFSMPLFFVPDENVGEVEDPNSAFNNQPRQLDRISPVDFRGQKVAFASSPEQPGAATLATATISFDVQTPSTGLKVANLPTPAQPPFLPVVEKADVRIPAIDHLLGSSGVSGARTIGFHDKYLNSQTNPADLFAQVLPESSPNQGLQFPADKAGGVATPNVKIDGLSRSLGVLPNTTPIPNTPNLADGKFDPGSVFAAADAKLLGGISLASVIQEVSGGAFANQIPKLTTSVVTMHIADPIPHDLPVALDTRLDWNPKVQMLTEPTDLMPLVTSAATTLKIETLTHAPLTPDGAADFFADGTLSNFSLDLFGIVRVNFKELHFRAEQGHKTILSTSGVSVEFEKELKILSSLAQVLPQDGFGAGASLDINTEGITASYSLGLPIVGLGVFSLENIALKAQLSLLFDAPVGLHLSFSEKYHPFLVSISLIAGAGFVGIDLDSSGIKQIEGSLELGGNITLNLFIVEANIHAMIGFYFQYNAPDKTIEFSAFIRIGGSVDILGIISVSVELYVALIFTPYLPGDQDPDHAGFLGEVGGSASLTIGVHVLFVDKSFTLTLERRFQIPVPPALPLLDSLGRSASQHLVAAVASGTATPPESDLGSLASPSLTALSFDQMINLSDWQTHCQAFA